MPQLQFFAVVDSRCRAAEAYPYRLACSEDHRDSAVAVRCLVVDCGGSTVQFIDWVVLFMDKLLTARRCARHALACWRIPVEIPQVQFWDKVFTLVCCPSLWRSRWVGNCVVSQLPVVH